MQQTELCAENCNRSSLLLWVKPRTTRSFQCSVSLLHVHYTDELRQLCCMQVLDTTVCSLMLGQRGTKLVCFNIIVIVIELSAFVDSNCNKYVMFTFKYYS
jgi:hypothetical protein